MHAYTPMKGTSFTAVKSEKKIVQMMCLSTRVHTSIYQYILVCTITSHVFIQIRLEPPCKTVSSPLPSCAVERPQRSSWPWFVDRQTTHILVHTCTYHMQRMYQYIPVHTSMYWYIPHHTHVFLGIWACLSTRRYRSVCRLSYRHSQVVSFLRIPTCNEICYPMYWYMGLIKSL